jgi:23S rRNA (cytidine1920-2'-O)/16S rRNA (cytidine1409-2'-O)-methyltransferase
MKQRLDVAMLSRQLVESREKAQALILSGKVMVDGQKAEKPGHSVADTARIEVTEA